MMSLKRYLCFVATHAEKKDFKIFEKIARKGSQVILTPLERMVVGSNNLADNSQYICTCNYMENILERRIELGFLKKTQYLSNLTNMFETIYFNCANITGNEPRSPALNPH